MTTLFCVVNRDHTHTHTLVYEPPGAPPASVLQAQPVFF